MKIISFGDLHIGAGCDPDVLAATDEIIDTAKKIKPDLIVITGDVYDSTSDPESREIAKDIVIGCANVSPVSIIKGNHDARKDLLILGNLQAPYQITVYEQPGCVAYPVQDPCVFVHYLSWFTKAAWTAMRSGVNMGIQSGNDAVSLLALEFLKTQVSKYGPGKHLLFAHLMISGSRAENHQPLLGEGITFGYHDLVEAGFAGGAFGHIHLAQVFGDSDAGSPEFRYNGAVAAMNYGESARYKTFSILDTDTMVFDVRTLHTIARINLDAYWGINGLGWVAPEGLPTESGARVKVKALIEEGYSADDAAKAIRESPLIVAPLELKIEMQSKPHDQVRAATIAAAKTACQKLEAYWAATGTTPDEPMRTDMLQIASDVETECSTN